MENFADVLRTNLFDYYPHVSDIEANEAFMKQINKHSVMPQFKPITDFAAKQTFEKMSNLPLQETFVRAIKPDLDKMTFTVASEFK